MIARRDTNRLPRRVQAKRTRRARRSFRPPCASPRL